MGKTAPLTVLAAFISDQRRLVLIKDTSEVQMTKPNLVRFEERRERPRRARRDDSGACFEGDDQPTMLSEKAEPVFGRVAASPQELQISGDGAPLSPFAPVLEQPWASVGGISLAMFSDPAASASETSFGSINLTVSLEGSFDNYQPAGLHDDRQWLWVGNQLSPRRLTARTSPPKGEFWEQPAMQQLAIAELDQTVKEFRIDTSREYLTGYSMGAADSYRIAYKWPDRFAAIATGAGTVQPIPASLGPDRAKIDEHTNPFTVEPEPFSALATRIKVVPTWVFHGDADTVVSIEQSRRLVAALRAAGATVRYTEMSATGHNDGVDKMYGNVELITWLLAQRRRAKALQ